MQGSGQRRGVEDSGIVSRVGSGLRGTAAIVAALVLAVAWTSPRAQGAGRIDGSSAQSFERSVAALQNALPPRRRADSEIALAVIWPSETVGSGDLDRDGDQDADDGRSLEQSTRDLLGDIQRGDLVAAIEKRETAEYSAADYFRELHGLGYEGVVALADRPGSEDYLATLREQRKREACAERGRWPSTRVRCEGDAVTQPHIGTVQTGQAFAAAIAALNARDYAGARAAMDELKLERLSPYERSKAEEILFHVAYAEQSYAEAGEHLRLAIAAGGLNEQETRAAEGAIRDIDARLAANPR